MPHSPYTHEIIELTDGRCYCLACDEVVAQNFLDARGENPVEDEAVRTEASPPSTSGT